MPETDDRDILKLVEPTRVPAAMNPRLGIGGGGQLAKRTALAGLRHQLETDRRRTSAAETQSSCPSNPPSHPTSPPASSASARGC